ncbi:major type 1 subunit fimbrin (pilin) [Rosenbergiella nectarea]|uniref:Major type 1 subunit fimbrin (Pilin) n=1 Tax=Rosenbergiella nectarea TaxID=988801 RepID=A0A1H9IQY5_9GAMM|nr:fimbrial protein [Rosenbergiella nectarea]SEQ76927.1 major type 1 subunit fimbrin (pilin) [Rosenbergiella nectarea]
MSKYKVLLCTALLFPLSQLAHAADPTKLTDQQGIITFTGALTGETCEIVGDRNFNVLLPKLSISTLKESGSEAGSKEFIISVKNCSSTLKNIGVHFEAVGGSDKDSVTGNLKNSLAGATNAASNVQVRLYQEQKQIRLGDTSTAVALVNNAADMRFAGGYYSTGQATAGLIEAKAIYTIAYP